MFLIAYAMDPKTWRQGSVALERDDGVLEAIALAFARHTQRAIQRGLLQGYRREEDALNTVRGRIRFGDQIGRRFGIPLPIEVAFDEFTEDIEENRLLKTAIHRLGHTFIRSDQIRREVRSLRPAFTTVGLGSYRRGAAPEVRYTRLNDHYRPAVELARLIIENSSLELLHGKVAGASLRIDMNMVFERFLYVALREALGLPERQWRHEERLDLDERKHIKMYPDLSWWAESRPLFVGDAKYKKLDTPGFRHADIYQMLAYCTAADLPSGLLVYAAGKIHLARTRSSTRARRLRWRRWTSGARRKTSSARFAASPPSSGRTGTSSRHASPHRASDTAPPTPSPAWPSRQRPGAQRLPSTHCPHGPKPLPSLQHTRERTPVRNPPPTKPSRQRPVIPAPPLTSFPRRRESRRWRGGGATPTSIETAQPPEATSGSPKAINHPFCTFQLQYPQKNAWTIIRS